MLVPILISIIVLLISILAFLTYKLILIMQGIGRLSDAVNQSLNDWSDIIDLMPKTNLIVGRIGKKKC